MVTINRTSGKISKETFSNTTVPIDSNLINSDPTTIMDKVETMAVDLTDISNKATAEEEVATATVEVATGVRCQFLATFFFLFGNCKKFKLSMWISLINNATISSQDMRIYRIQCVCFSFTLQVFLFICDCCCFVQLLQIFLHWLICEISFSNYSRANVRICWTILAFDSTYDGDQESTTTAT